MKASDELVVAFVIGGILILVMLAMIQHARNTARNRAIEKILADLAEYELESVLPI